MNIYTSGMLETYKECPAKYNLIYNENVQIPSDNSYSEIGNQIHALINYYYKGFDIKKMTDFVDRDKDSPLKILWDNFQKIKPNNVLESEYVFNVKITDNTLLTGRIDGIFKDGENIVIADWKTGSENTNYEENAQTMVYLFSVYNLLAETKKINKFENLSMIYYFLKTKNKKQIKLSREYFEKIKNDIIFLTKKINGDNTYNKGDNANCDCCCYKNICSRGLGQSK